jgi:hypothetical protein
VIPQPPYALAAPEFRYRALTSLAGRAPLGGEREIALAALMTARLVAASLPPSPLPIARRLSRVAGARGWFASLALPPGVRAPFMRLVEATANEQPQALRTALANVLEVTQPLLAPSAHSELRAVARAMDRSS